MLVWRVVERTQSDYSRWWSLIMWLPFIIVKWKLRDIWELMLVLPQKILWRMLWKNQSFLNKTGQRRFFGGQLKRKERSHSEHISNDIWHSNPCDAMQILRLRTSHKSNCHFINRFDHIFRCFWIKISPTNLRYSPVYWEAYSCNLMLQIFHKKEGGLLLINLLHAYRVYNDSNNNDFILVHFLESIKIKM